MLAGLALFATGTAASGDYDRAAACDLSIALILETESSPSEQAIALEQLVYECAGTGLYEARLGVAYILIGRLEEAERLLQKSLETTTGFERELKWVLADVFYLQSRGDEAETVARELIAKHPDWPGGYTALAKALLVTDDLEGVVSAAEMSNLLYEDAGNYLLLTMAHFNLGNYPESAQAMQTSLRMDMSGLTVTDAVASGALSLLVLGDYEAGWEMLQKHVELVPEAIDSPNYQHALQHFERAAQE